MSRLPTSRVFLIALLLVLPPTACALADGFVIKQFGQYVREEEQRAFIEWADGQEKMYVATRTEATSVATLWIVPVPAAAETVKAEPVEHFPHVSSEKSVAKEAGEAVMESVGTVLMMDTGGVCCIPAMGSNANKTFTGVGTFVGGSVTVHSHVEKLGLAVETLTAKSTDALDQYLAAHKLDVKAANIRALAPYLEQNCTLVCTWHTETTAKEQARAVCIEFPTPTVFFPLRPSRVYESKIDTLVYVRGWWQPVGDTAPGISCTHVNAKVTSGKDSWWSPIEKVTRVGLDSLPTQWTTDLEMEPGVPFSVHVAQWIISWSKNPIGVPLASGLLGALVCLLLPSSTISLEVRNRDDYLWAIFVGLTFSLTAIGAVIAYWLWQRQRIPKLRFFKEVDWWVGKYLRFAGIVFVHAVTYAVCAVAVAMLLGG